MTDSRVRPDVDTGSPAPHLARILVRSVTACLLTEISIVIALSASGWHLPWDAWAYATGWGLGAGAAFAVAEAAMRRWGLCAALVVGALLSPLAVLGATFELSFVQTWSTHEATQAVLAHLADRSASHWTAHATAAVFAYGSLLVALYRRASPMGQALAMATGSLLWAAVVFFVGRWSVAEALSVRDAPLLLLAPALMVPPGRSLGDWLFRTRSSRVTLRPTAGRRRLLQATALGLVALLPPVALLRAPPLSIEDLRLRWRAWSEADVVAMRALPRGTGSSHFGRSVPLLASGDLGTAWFVLASLRLDWDAVVKDLWRVQGGNFPLVDFHDDENEWRLLGASLGDLTAMRELTGTVGFEGRDAWRPHTAAEHWVALTWTRQLVAIGDWPRTVLSLQLLEIAEEGLLSHAVSYVPEPIHDALPSRALRLEALDLARQACASGEAPEEFLLQCLRQYRPESDEEELARTEEMLAVCDRLASVGRGITESDVADLRRTQARLAKRMGRPGGS